MADLFRPPPRPNAQGAAPPPRPPEAPRPLADRLRPMSQIEDIIDQEHLLGPDAPLGRMLAEGNLGSIILWGPPGVGKTTIARLLAAGNRPGLRADIAIFTGVADLKKSSRRPGCGAERPRHAAVRGRDPPFQQGAAGRLFALIEDGTILLVGATTETPASS